MLLDHHAEVQSIRLQAGFGGAGGVSGSPQLAQNGDLELLRFVMPGIARQRPLNQVEGVVPVVTAAGDPRQFEIAAVLPRRIPDGFVEGVEGFVVAPLKLERQAEVVVRLAVVGVGVAQRQAADRLAEVGFGGGEFAASQQQQAERVVAAAVERVAPQRFLVVRFRLVGRMAILFEMQPVEEQFLVGFDLGGRTGGGRRVGDVMLLIDQLAHTTAVRRRSGRPPA